MPPKSRQEFLASLEELTCPICTESFESQATGGKHYAVELAGCRHVYGADCIETWVTTSCSNHNTCPTCRAVLFEKSRRRTNQASQTNRANRASQANQATGANQTRQATRASQATRTERAIRNEEANRANRQYRAPDEVHRGQAATIEEATRAPEEHVATANELRAGVVAMSEERQLLPTVHEFIHGQTADVDWRRTARVQQEAELIQWQTADAEPIRPASVGELMEWVRADDGYRRTWREQQQREAARVQQQREAAYNELTRNLLLFGGEEGAMYQFLSYAVREIAMDCYRTFRWG